jgi:hypothetical protein
MGQRTLAFTRLLLREVSCNTLGNLGLLLSTQSNHSFNTLGEMTKEQYTKRMQQSEHKFNKKVKAHR